MFFTFTLYTFFNKKWFYTYHVVKRVWCHMIVNYKIDTVNVQRLILRKVVLRNRLNDRHVVAYAIMDRQWNVNLTSKSSWSMLDPIILRVKWRFDRCNIKEIIIFKANPGDYLLLNFFSNLMMIEWNWTKNAK